MKQQYYSDCIISKHHGGFGMYQAGEYSDDLKWANISDLLGEIADGDYFVSLDEALVDERFIELGIEDIRGKVHNEPEAIYAKIEDNTLTYIGIGVTS